MNKKRAELFFFLFWLSTTAFGQLKIPDCPLDSTDFAKHTQYKLWKRDSQNVLLVENRINYLALLHRNYLPQHFPLKKTTKAYLSAGEQKTLLSLDSLYLNKTRRTRDRYLGKNPGFNENLPIFARLNFVVIFETLELYPELYSMLLHPTHAFESTQEVKSTIEALYLNTRTSTKLILDNDFKQFVQGMEALQKENHAEPLWQGALTDEDREKYAWISFLIWCNRKY